MFTRSLAQFARYSNPTQFFHEGELFAGEIADAGKPIARACASVPYPPPARISHTVHFAQWVVETRDCSVAGVPELAFGYIDRELDCLRTKLQDSHWKMGRPSKRAIVLDLLLENSTDSTPIMAELKIRNDEDALYGLIQCLSFLPHTS